MKHYLAKFLPFLPPKTEANGTPVNLSWQPGANLRFSKFFIEFFISRPNWISDLSQSSTKTLFCAKTNLRRRQNLWEIAKNALFEQFLESFRQKVAFFFGARAFLKISIYWLPLNPPLMITIMHVSFVGPNGETRRKDEFLCICSYISRAPNWISNSELS